MKTPNAIHLKNAAKLSDQWGPSLSSVRWLVISVIGKTRPYTRKSSIACCATSKPRKNNAASSNSRHREERRPRRLACKGPPSRCSVANFLFPCQACETGP